MIVGTTFEGDDDNHLAWLQHDVYRDALGIIISMCNSYARFARDLLDDQTHPEWGTVERCDHRTLQGAHDLLAGAWRYHNDCRQPDLPFTDSNPDHSAQRLWLDWLAMEVGGWINHPHLVRSVQLILTNQNQPPGYAAEARLCLDILDRFPDVPWKPQWRSAYERDLSKDRGKLIRAKSGGQTPSATTMMCECTEHGRKPCNQIPCRTTIERAAREGWGPLE